MVPMILFTLRQTAYGSKQLRTLISQLCIYHLATIGRVKILQFCCKIKILVKLADPTKSVDMVLHYMLHICPLFNCCVS